MALPAAPFLERLPPHDVEAEEAVIAAILVDPEAISRVSSILKAPDFFREKITASDRAKFIEQAIFDLHQVKLRIEVRVVDSVIAPQEASETAKAPVDDPLIAAGKALGGVVDD